MRYYKLKKRNSNIIVRFIKLIDKYIVIPITRLILKITSKIDKSNHRLESILAKQTTLLFLSLRLTISNHDALGFKSILENKYAKKRDKMDDFKDLWEEAKLQDEQAGNSTNNNTFSW